MCWIFELPKQLAEIQRKLDLLLQKDTNMAVSLQQIDAEIASENTTLTGLAALATQLDADVAALVAKVGQGQDFTAELNALQANAALLSTSVSNVQSADVAAGGTPPATHQA